MNGTVPLIATGSALTVSVFSSVVAWWSLKWARTSGRAGYIQNLMFANRAALDFPELLIDVHGVDPATSAREARALVYLSTLLDGFWVAHHPRTDADCSRMVSRMKRDGDSLCRILAVPENAARWKIVRDRSYGDFEPRFIAAVEELIEWGRPSAGLTPNGK
jgi:hypothetical protein